MARSLGRYVQTILLLSTVAGCACWDSPTSPNRQPIWDIPIARSGGMIGAPSAFGGMLFAPIGPIDTRMQAFGATTGAIRWEAAMAALDCAPIRIRAAGTAVFVASCGGAVAYDVSTGQTRWATRLTDHANSPTPFAVDSAALYLADRVSGRVSSLDVRTGHVRWTWRDSAARDTPSPVLHATVAARGNVYVVGARELDANRLVRGVIIELDGATGAERRRFTTPDSVSDYRAGTFDGAHRLVLSNLGRSGVDAFDLDSWELAWRVRRAGGFAGPTSDPSIMDGVVYTGWQSAEAMAIDLATGRERWSTAVRGGIYSVVACKNEVVAQHFALTWFDRQSGRIRAANLFEDSKEFPISQLATDGERVYAVSWGRAYAYRCE